MKKDITNQNGIASIVITIVLSAVLTIVIVGFSAISRREQRQALDEQLSSQAFYAAEAEVNKIIAQIKEGGLDAVSDSTNCNPTGTNTFVGSSDATTTCVLIDKTPSTLEYSVGVDETVVAQVNTDQPITSLHFKWTDASGVGAATCSTAAYSSLPASVSGNLGMVRVDITRADNTNRSILADRNYSMLLYPKDTTATPPSLRYSTSSARENFISSKYPESEYNAWTARVNSGEAAFPNNPSTGKSWKAFWNWLPYYRASEGRNAGSIPQAVGGLGSLKWGEYERNRLSPSGPRSAFFTEWAMDVMTGNAAYYPVPFPNGDPEEDKYIGSADGTRVTYAPANNAQNPIVTGGCNGGTGYANVLFTDQIKGPYIVRMRNVYKLSRVEITAYQSNGTTTPFTTTATGGGQVRVEVTARVRDVVRRIEVRLPTGQSSGGTLFPDQALRTTESLCKKLETNPTSTTDRCSP